jgi:uncharacterized protein YndB with AHSA1/START domain
MESKKENAEGTAGRELVLTRLLNAPRELVWEVFVSPEHIKNWWGPNGFTNTIDKMEVKPGGTWDFMMHGPDGKNYKNIHLFKEVVKPERLVFEHAVNPKFITTITFTAQGERTLLNWHMLFESKEQLEQVVKVHKADEGLEQNVEKLERYLAVQKEQKASGMEKTNNKELMITRVINAPLQMVWEAWTDEEKIEQWWGPAGFTNPVCQWNAQAGNKILIHMKAPDGVVYPMDGEFREIVKYEKIVFTSAALDEKGERLFDVLNTINFSEENGKTKLILHFVVSKVKAAGERHIAGQEMGWNLSLDRLEELTKHMSFTIARTFNAPISKVWNAITNCEEMKKWYFDLPGFKPEVGFEFSFTGGPEDRKYVHLCKITDVITGKKLTYSWRYDGYEGNSFVTWELFDEGEKTRLTLTHEGLETFPATNPDFARKNFAEGWTYIVGTSLTNYFHAS